MWLHALEKRVHSKKKKKKKKTPVDFTVKYWQLTAGAFPVILRAPV